MRNEITYDRVLVPTDGSESAGTALDHAIGIATRYDATLYGVYVVDTAAIGPHVEATMVYDSLREQGQNVLDDLEATAEAAGVTGVETEVLQGTPHRGILDHAEDEDVDLIVMGTHGRRGLERYLLGSVAEKVVRLSTAPVLTVHADEDDAEGDGSAAAE